MQDLVGQCKACKRKIYCNDGFINGIVLEDTTLICFDCSEHEQSVSGNQ